MNEDEKRARVRELSKEFIRRGEPYQWFDVLYKEAERGETAVPWDDLEPNANMVAFWKAHPWDTAGQRALVVGCGLGDDAQEIAAWGFRATAFDVSETAIEMAKKRFAGSPVEFRVADLFAAPPEFAGTFDFVFECNTVQALPTAIRENAVRSIAGFVKPGGRLLVIARAREESEPEGQIPWPLTRCEIDGFVRAGLREESFEDFNDRKPPGTRRFRALYRRP